MQEFQNELEILRKEVDEVDSIIYQAIYNRTLLTNKIGQLKKNHGVIEMSLERRQEIYKKLTDWATIDNIPTELFTKIYDTIFEFSINKQLDLINKEVITNEN
jgi:chorismate mutase